MFLFSQVFSSDNVSGAGVYWMFYSGSNFESTQAPAGLHGLEAGKEVEGLRCALPCYRFSSNSGFRNLKCIAGWQWHARHEYNF